MQNKIKILNREYEVWIVDLQDERLDGSLGKCYFENATIYIGNRLNQSDTEDTYYHELCHALVFESGFHKMILDRLGEDINEVFIDSLSKCLKDAVKNAI